VDRTALIGVPTSAGPRVPLPPADRLLLFGFDDPDDLGEAQQALLARHAPHFGQGLTLAEAMACLEVFLASSAGWSTVWWPHSPTEASARAPLRTIRS
jgi:hypothetical protein